MAVSYNDIENLTEEVKKFIEDKGFKFVDTDEFTTRLENVIYEGIDKYNDD